MSIQVIPVSTNPYQQFTVDLEGQTVDLTFRWNQTAEQWYMDFIGVTFEETLYGIAVVSGIDLLGPHAVRELGTLWLVDLEEKNGDPGQDDFGDRFQLMYVGLE